MLLAAHGPELLHGWPPTRGAQLRFEAAVGGGVPLIHGVREGLAGDQLTGVAGILNGTCNYILSRMAATRRADGRRPGRRAAARLRRSRSRPPTSTATMPPPSWSCSPGSRSGGILQLSRTSRRRSIRPITSADFRYARRLGCTIRQISQVRKSSATASTRSSDRRSCPGARASAATRARTTSSASTASTAARAASAAPEPAVRPRPSRSCPTCWR